MPYVLEAFAGVLRIQLMVAVTLNNPIGVVALSYPMERSIRWLACISQVRR